MKIVSKIYSILKKKFFLLLTKNLIVKWSISIQRNVQNNGMGNCSKNWNQFQLTSELAKNRILIVNIPDFSPFILLYSLKCPLLTRRPLKSFWLISSKTTLRRELPKYVDIEWCHIKSFPKYVDIEWCHNKFFWALKGCLLMTSHKIEQSPSVTLKLPFYQGLHTQCHNCVNHLPTSCVMSLWVIL